MAVLGCFPDCSVATSYVALSRLVVMNINTSQSCHYPALNLSPVLSSQHMTHTNLLDPTKSRRSSANLIGCRPVPWQRFRVCVIADVRGLDASQCALCINTVLASAI
jgi:hypothetical protein